jgi:2-keto-4-pentenoate hydratase
MNTTQIQQALAQLLPAWRDHARIDALAATYKPQTRSEGYALQRALFDACGETPLGWKIAATSQAGQNHIGVSGPLAGRLMQSRCLPETQVVSLDRNTMAVAEAEFAFRLGRDVTRTTKGPLTMREVMDCVQALHVAIEIPNSRFIDFARAGEAQLIADFACACFVVLGREVTEDWRTVDLAHHQVSVLQNGAKVANGVGSNVLGDPRIALTWLANELLDQGMQLQAGELVMTGTCVVPVPVKVGDHVIADFGAFGHVQTRFV